MHKNATNQTATEVTDLRDTLRESPVTSTTTRQSLSELERLLVDLPMPTGMDPILLGRLPAVVEAVADLEISQKSVTDHQVYPQAVADQEISQKSVALPTASRPTGIATGEESSGSPSVIVDLSVIVEQSGRSVARIAQGKPTPLHVPVPPPPPPPLSGPRLSEAAGSGAPLPVDNAGRSATTRQSMVLVPKAPPAIASALSQERAAWLVIMAGSQHPRGYIVPLTFARKMRYRIGGDPSCEIVITSPVVSREHAEIGFDTTLNGFFVSDLGSTNGTYVQLPGMELQQVSGTAALRDNSLIWLGREQVRFSFRCY